MNFNSNNSNFNNTGSKNAGSKNAVSKNTGRLFSVDPSLTCSGWVLFDLERDSPLQADTISPPGAGVALSERLSFLQLEITRVMASLSLGSKDILLCEGPGTLVKNPSSSTKVEQVRSMFETIARDRGISVPGRINPRTVHTELLGLRGAQLERSRVKEIARGTIRQLYEKQLLSVLPCEDFSKVSQDIVDATLLAAYAAPLIRRAKESGLQLGEVFTFDKKKGRSRPRGGSWTENDFKKIVQSR